MLTRDSVTVTVDAVVYFRISNATLSVTNILDAPGSTKLLAQSTLRNMIGNRNLIDILTDREGISSQMQVSSGSINRNGRNQKHLELQVNSERR